MTGSKTLEIHIGVLTHYTSGVRNGRFCQELHLLQGESTARKKRRTYLEAYIAENMVAIHPTTFVLKFQLGNHMVFTIKISKEKLWGGMAGVF